MCDSQSDAPLPENDATLAAALSNWSDFPPEEVAIWASWPEVPADEIDQFDPRGYLSEYYVGLHEDYPIHQLLSSLTDLVRRIPRAGGRALLDLGAGPTVHLPLALNSVVDDIYTSDYSAANREELQRWWHSEPGHFDWSTIYSILSSRNAVDSEEVRVDLEQFQEAEAVAQATRAKIRAILTVNVLEEPVINRMLTYPADAPVPDQFDIVSTTFCLEYATETHEQFATAMRNSLRLLKPGGYLLQGGLFHRRWAAFNNLRWRCHYLQQNELIDCLADNDMETEGDHFSFTFHKDQFMLLSRKKANHAMS